MRWHAHGDELVRAHAQDIEESTIEAVERPIDAGRQDRVVEALASKRSVGEFGRQSRVTLIQSCPGKYLRHRDIGVGIVDVDSMEEVVGSASRSRTTRA